MEVRGGERDQTYVRVEIGQVKLRFSTWGTNVLTETVG